MSDQYVYGFVNTELDSAQRAIQFGHAVLQMMHDLPDQVQQGRADPINKTPNFVLFGIIGEKGILETAKLLDLEVSSVPFTLWYEPDHDLGYTAICTVPIRGVIREAFSGFDMLEG